MTNLKTAHYYEFSLIEDLYNYILESYLNGQFEQVSEILHRLNDVTLFIDWLNEANFCKPLSLLNCYFIHNQETD